MTDATPPRAPAPHPGGLPDHLGVQPEDPVQTAAHATPDAATQASVVRMAHGSNPLPRKAFFSDSADRYLFLLFAGIGIVLICLMKLGFAITGLVTAIPPTAILVLYAAAVWRQQYFRLHPDRLGDNCYYMGFIFTLTSLSVALIQLEDASADLRANLLETLIGNFGIALSSTIVGIALRVFFIQFRREVEDEEQLVRQDLQAKSAMLRDNLGLAVSDLESFRLRVVQVLDEQVISVATRFAAVQNELVAKAEATSVIFATVQADMTGRSHDVSAAMLDSAKILGDNTAKIAAELRGLITRIDRIEAPPDLLVRHLAGAESRITSLTEALSGYAMQDSKRAAAFEAATTALLAQLSVFADTSKFARLDATAGDLQQRFDTLTKAVGAYHLAIEGLTAHATSEQSALAGIRETMQQDARNSAEASHLLQDTLSEIARGIAAKLG